MRSLQLLVLLALSFSSCRSPKTNTSALRTSYQQVNGASITHVAQIDEGVGFPFGNNAYSIGFELWPDIPQFISSSTISAMYNPKYEAWVRAHKLEDLSVQFQRIGEASWHAAEMVAVEYAYGSETSVFNEGDMRNSRCAASFESLPEAMRLVNRQYIFHFRDMFSPQGTRIRVSYSFGRPDGSVADVDTIVNYRLEEYQYIPY